MSRLRESGTIIHSSFCFFSNFSPSFQTFFHSRPPCVSSDSTPVKSNGRRSGCDFANRPTLPSIWTPHQFSSGIPFHPRSSFLKQYVQEGQCPSCRTVVVGGHMAFRLVDLYIDSETLELMGKEHALLVCNHKSDIDWLIGWVLAQRSGCLGSALALIKKSLKFLPVIGWSMWFTEYIFLERNWSKDKNTLKAGFENLRDFPMPFWLAVFVEGTRFTQAKLLAAQEYAVATKLPVPKNVLIPRTKGFVAAVNHLRSFVPAIYNCTVAIPKDEPLPTVLRMFGGRSSRIKRHLICDLPETDDAIRQWCRDIFIEKAKERILPEMRVMDRYQFKNTMVLISEQTAMDFQDASLELHHFKNSFEDMECHGIGRPKKSLFVVIVWSCVLIYGGVEFFKWCSFSWGTIAFCAVVLLVVVISMHVLILFSQSEKSNPPQEASAINSQDILKHKLLP